MPNKTRRRRRPNKSRARRKGRSKNSSSPHMGLGAQIGSRVGAFAERGLRSLFGSGDYSEEYEHAGGFEVNDNSIVKPLTAAPVPELHSGSDLAKGMMRVTHREFLFDLSTGTDPGGVPGPNNGVFRLNPSDGRTFPWLSTLARNFEQWCPHGIVVEFVSTCGNAVSSTNAALGSISLATQYNSEAQAFSSKAQLLNHYYAVSTKTAENLMHAVECNPDEIPTKLLYTGIPSVGNPYPGDDRLYDLGFLNFWLQGSQDVYTAGELWITYDISLLKPRIDPSTLPPGISVAELYRERYPRYYVSNEVAPSPLDEAKEADPPNDDDSVVHVGRSDPRPPDFRLAGIPAGQAYRLAKYLPGYSPAPSRSALVAD